MLWQTLQSISERASALKNCAAIYKEYAQPPSHARNFPNCKQDRLLRNASFLRLVNKVSVDLCQLRRYVWFTKHTERGNKGMASIISQLYHDKLRLSERDYPEDSRAFILLDSFKEDAEWLKKMLDGPAREHLLELINIHDELDGLVSYESFRDGFILGARLMMEVACGQSRFSEGD